MAQHAATEANIIHNQREHCPALARIDFIDTIPLARQIVPDLPNCKLDTLLAHFSVKQPADRHRAGADVEVTAQVFIQLICAAAGLVPGYDLESRLADIRPGIAGWPAYEKYCEDLLSFLFVPPLNPPIPQSRDERHVNRRDYVLPNYAADGGFWQFMRTHYEAHLVVAEVKNLSRGPGKDEILQVANYLNPRGAGLFALILARMDLD